VFRAIFGLAGARYALSLHEGVDRVLMIRKCKRHFLCHEPFLGRGYPLLPIILFNARLGLTDENRQANHALDSDVHAARSLCRQRPIR